ncbi:Expansin, cellulose-binding-like domain [Dillenia turbinata]|uniref:Expansin, cellulose-binding-like domain n=1 Tax=Dillenia turbinata TaxID=194707 RepID=A0AAN8UQF4_9MAGN
MVNVGKHVDMEVQKVNLLFLRWFRQEDPLCTAEAKDVEFFNDYKQSTIVFKVDTGSNDFYFATLIEYENGDGDLGKVEIQVNGASLSLQRSHGAVWSINAVYNLNVPFSISLTTLSSRKTLVATNVIPAGWLPGHSYRSLVNFI